MNMYLRFPEGKNKALTLSYDDGVFTDKRMIKILDKHGLKCTFNLNSGLFSEKDAVVSGRLSLNQAKELYTHSCHEIAIHGKTHPFLEKLPLPVALHDIIEDRKCLEHLFGRIVRGMAYPYGTYNEALVDGLGNLGIAYARTVISTQDFRLPTDWLRLTATCHHNDPALSSIVDKFLQETPERDPWLFYLWGHTYEFDNDNNWNVIEEFAEKLGKNSSSEIWYATNIEIYEYIEAYRRLVFSIDFKYVYNPSAIPVWFAADNDYSKKIIEVEAGKTKSLINI